VYLFSVEETQAVSSIHKQVVGFHYPEEVLEYDYERVCAKLLYQSIEIRPTRADFDENS
jgi:hypothetical protein